MKRLFSPLRAVLIFSLLADGSLRAEEKVEALYQNYCASCHGSSFEGGSGGNLIDDTWKHGGSDDEIASSIARGIVAMGMPAFEKSMREDQIRSLVILLREKQHDQNSRKSAPPKPLADQSVNTKHHAYKLQVVTPKLNAPWGLAFLPDGRMLVTEKGGALRQIAADGTLLAEAVENIPASVNHGQGGLLAVAVHPDYAKMVGSIWHSRTALRMSGERRARPRRWCADASKKMSGASRSGSIDRTGNFYGGSGVHFGTRIVFDQGYLYFIVGERGGNMEAQDLTRPNGKIFRLFDDGRVPADNPFAGQADAEKGIWSYGHRNPQGLAKDLRDGTIYATEHGPRGGDEFNRIRKGGNYGWPVITYGMHYDGRPITAITAKEGMEQPIKHWTPSIAASGLTYYAGDQFPKWKHDFFAGSLKAQELHRLRVVDGKLQEEEIVLKNAGKIREVQTGPDGAIYLVLNGPDAIAKMVPQSLD